MMFVTADGKEAGGIYACMSYFEGRDPSLALSLEMYGPFLLSYRAREVSPWVQLSRWRLQLDLRLLFEMKPVKDA